MVAVIEGLQYAVVYLEYQSFCSIVGIGSPHLPPLTSECVSLLGPKREGEQHSLAGEGGPNSDDWIESLALCILCEPHIVRPIPFQPQMFAAATIFLVGQLTPC
jgi:hypothetical protein